MKKALLLTIAAALYLTSCKKNDMSVSRQGDINVTIEGIVKDIDGNTPISGVKVTTNIDGRILTSVTDTNGFYYIKDLNSGSYNVIFSLNGYGSMSRMIEANPVNFTGNHYIANYNLSMFKFNQTLSTRIVMQKGVPPAEEYLPVANRPVSIYLSEGFINNKIIDTTDAAGNISIPNLPNDNVRVELDFVSGDYHYYLGSYGSISDLPFNFGVTSVVNEENINMFYLMNSNIIVSSTGNSTTAFINTGNISFQFSTPVDLNFQDVVIDLKKGGVDVAKLVTWSNNNSLLTINPIGTSLDTSANYSVELYLKSMSGINYPSSGTGYFYFQVKSPQYKLNQVTSLLLVNPATISAFTNIIDIQFDRVPNADYYTIYGQYGKADEYLYLTSYTPGDPSTTPVQATVTLSDLPGITVPINGLFYNGAVYNILVRAERYDGVTGLFSAPLKLNQ